MPDLEQQLIDAAESGDLDGVRAALAAGADIHANADDPLHMAAVHGHLGVVECLLAAGADLHAAGDYAVRVAAAYGHSSVVDCLIRAGASVRTDRDLPLVLAAKNGHAAVMKLLIPHGVGDLALMELPQFTDVAQVVLLETVNVSKLSVIALAGEGVCPAALCVLLERQGNTELAAMFSATQMLEPLTPEARAEMLGDLRSNHPQPELAHAGP